MKIKRERFRDGEIHYALFDGGEALPVGTAVKTRDGRLWCASEFSWIGANAAFHKTLGGAVSALREMRMTPFPQAE